MAPKKRAAWGDRSDSDEPLSPGSFETFELDATLPRGKIAGKPLETVRDFSLPVSRLLEGRADPVPLKLVRAAAADAAVIVRCGAIELRLKLPAEAGGRSLLAAIVSPFLRAYNARAAQPLEASQIERIDLGARSFTDLSSHTCHLLSAGAAQLLELRRQRAAAGQQLLHTDLRLTLRPYQHQHDDGLPRS